MDITRYVALLRGINVGGNNIIKMSDLKACFEEMGFIDVVTYIQSGNVLFSVKQLNKQILVDTIEEKLSERFTYQSRIALISIDHLRAIVELAPASFGSKPDEYKYDVLFLRESLTVEKALGSISVKEGVDEVFAANGVLYFSQLKSKASSSHLPKIVGQPIYKEITIRNWNTTTKLLLI